MSALMAGPQQRFVPSRLVRGSAARQCVSGWTVTGKLGRMVLRYQVLGVRLQGSPTNQTAPGD